jgi:hypothetical protein
MMPPRIFPPTENDLRGALAGVAKVEGRLEGTGFALIRIDSVQWLICFPTTFSQNQFMSRALVSKHENTSKPLRRSVGITRLTLKPN